MSFVRFYFQHQRCLLKLVSRGLYFTILLLQFLVQFYCYYLNLAYLLFSFAAEEIATDSKFSFDLDLVQ